MELHRGDLRHGDQPLDTIDLEVGLPVALDRRQLDEVGHARASHGVGKSFWCVDPIGRADDGAWPAPDVLDHPGTDLFEILGEIELGDGMAACRQPATAPCRGWRSPHP